MIQLIIIADDFTGGLDTGVQFAARGIRTRVVTDPETDYLQAADGCEVLVIVAETRHLPAQQAYDLVYRVVKKAREIGIPHIYKKTDSGLRGNIGAELTAALEASGEKKLTFLPSMPGNGRVTVRGIHYINGVPVNESVFGKDPFEPVTESDVARLIALQSDVPVWNAAPDMIPDRDGITVVDAETDDDLRMAGERMAAGGRLNVTAGCAGFAAVLPALLGLEIREKPVMPRMERGLFVLCGSVNPITQRQLDYAEKNGFTRLHIRPDQKLTRGYFDTAAGGEAIDDWRRMNRETPWLILDANDMDNRNTDSLDYATERGMSTEDMRSCISGALGAILTRMLESREKKSMLITGGDTLLQCMNQMGVTQMEPLLEVYPGVVLSIFTVGDNTRYVITKSGGFGQETLLRDLKELIESQQHNG